MKTIAKLQSEGKALMLEPDGIPHISPLFDCPESSIHSEQYLQAIRAILGKVVPNNFFWKMEESKLPLEKRAENIRRHLPIMKHSPLRCSAPTNISFYLLAAVHYKTCRFFFEMITSWLVPGTNLGNALLFAADFCIPDFGAGQVYTLCEVTMCVENASELQQVRRNLPTLETEILAGVRSTYHARKILESKGWTSDQKTAEIHEQIAHLVRRLPKDFDSDVFTEMQHVLVMCPDEFKTERNCRHLGRIISVFYLYRKTVTELVKTQPGKRHILLKLYRMQEKKKQGCTRNRLALIFAVNFLREKEVLEERHILSALRKHLPFACAVENSFLSYRRRLDSVVTIYLEVDCKMDHDLSLQEIQQLEKQLPKDLKDHIEHPMHPVFNPRNDEEMMRNIITLGNQIRSLRDLPQLHVSFDEQSYAHLYFTVIIVRILRKGCQSIRDMFKKSGASFTYIHERSKRIGLLRRKYPKEATVFRVKLPKEEFLREDYSIDIYKTRQHVVTQVAKVIGKLRDYNGGMIAKQNELLSHVRKLLGEEGLVNHFLLENFFYSLTPVIMRCVMEPLALKTLYQLLLQVFEQGILPGASYALRLHEDPEFLYAALVSEDSMVMDAATQAIQGFDAAPTSLATASILFNETPAVGWIYRSDSVQRRLAFASVLRESIGCQEEKNPLALRPVQKKSG